MDVCLANGRLEDNRRDAVDIDDVVEYKQEVNRRRNTCKHLKEVYTNLN